MVTADSEAGRSLLEAGRWSDARAVFEDALRKKTSAEALAGLAEALWWAGDVQASISYYQRAYTAYREQHDPMSAAMTAITLCITYKSCLGNDAAAGGWLARAETAAADGDPSALQGWFWGLRGFLAVDHDLVLALDLIQKALDYATLSGDRDLELVTRADLGAVLVMSGRVEEGLRLVDESMAGVSAGEHTRLDTVVFVCCVMLVACEMASDLERVSQWSHVTDPFIETYGCPYLYAECRSMYGSILVAQGRWADAERELRAAIKLTEGVYPLIHSLSVAHLAELMLRRGLLEEAGGLLAGIDREPQAALPLAAVKLARGEATTAIALLERVLRGSDEGHIASVRALELLVDAQLSNGDRCAACETLARLDAAARRRAGSEASARASMAAGRVARAHDECAVALGHFEKAMDGFARLGLPLESARARLAIAETACGSNPDLATIEAQRARCAFEELGAAADADKAAGLLRSLGVPTRPGPKRLGLLTRREQEVLRLLSSGLSNPEIAERLVISRKTASHHVSSLLSKLAVRNRAEAVAVAARAMDGAHAGIRS